MVIVNVGACLKLAIRVFAKGSLPAGLSLNGLTLSGTPTTAGVSDFILKAQSSDSVLGVTRPLEGLTQIQLTTNP